MLYRLRIPLLITASVVAYLWVIPSLFFYQPPLETLYSINDFHQDISKMYCDLGKFSQQRKDFNNAIKAYTRAIETNPAFLDCYEYLGTCLELCRKIDQAFQTYIKAISLDTSFLEKRMQKTFGPPPCTLPSHELPPAKLWTGQPLKNKTLLVYAERSLGDTIQLMRFLPLIVKQDAKVIFHVQSSLTDFLKNNLTTTSIEIVDESVPMQSLNFDYYSSLFRLPSLLRITRNSIPNPQGYLHASPEKIAYFKNNIFNTSEFKVGICWQGNPKNIYDKFRSTNLQYFYPLTKISGIKIYSLQRIDGMEQLKGLPSNIHITDLSSHLNSIDDLAAAIENMDLVISVDTLVSNLSGALGKTTWVLLSKVSDCRWLSYSEGSTSCWYTNVKKFRQHELGNWAHVFNTITKDLKKVTTQIF